MLARTRTRRETKEDEEEGEDEGREGGGRGVAARISFLRGTLAGAVPVLHTRTLAKRRARARERKGARIHLLRDTWAEAATAFCPLATQLWHPDDLEMHATV